MIALATLVEALHDLGMHQAGLGTICLKKRELFMLCSYAESYAPQK